MSDQTPLSAEQAGQLARIAQHEKSAIDPLCVCGHRASTHDATADSGDTRCLARGPDLRVRRRSRRSLWLLRMPALHRGPAVRSPGILMALRATRTTGAGAGLDW